MAERLSFQLKIQVLGQSYYITYFDFLRNSYDYLDKKLELNFMSSAARAELAGLKVSHNLNITICCLQDQINCTTN